MCFDIYCCICGNPCHSSEMMCKWFTDIIDEYKILSQKTKLDKNEKFRIEFDKNYYELSQKDPKFINKFKELNRMTKWMNKCSMLLMDNKVIHNVTENDCNVGFYDKDKNRYEHIVEAVWKYNGQKDGMGIFIHSDCLKHINNKFKNENVNGLIKYNRNICGDVMYVLVPRKRLSTEFI